LQIRSCQLARLSSEPQALIAYAHWLQGCITIKPYQGIC
jgi:hypothetical protein